jgi:hypothetical protein
VQATEAVIESEPVEIREPAPTFVLGDPDVVSEEPTLVVPAAEDYSDGESPLDMGSDAEDSYPAFRPPLPGVTERPRSRWRGLLALTATVLLAIWAAYRYQPIIESASRDVLDRWLGAPTIEAARLPIELPVLPSVPEPETPPSILRLPAGVDVAVVEPALASGVAAPEHAPAPRAPLAPLTEEPPPVVAAPPVAAIPPVSEKVPAPNAASKVPDQPAPAPPVEVSSALRRERARLHEPAPEESPRLEEASREEASRTSPAELAPENRVTVARSDPSILWRLSGATVERSDDGGQTWQPQRSSSSADLLDASAPSAEVCWAAGRDGTVMRTTDGENWESVTKPSAEDLVRVTAWNATSATVRSASGRRFSTVDGGVTWAKR